MNLVDNVIAYKILSMLVTPFEKTGAFKLGLIDKSGEVLKNAVTPEEKNVYTTLDRLVFSMKRIIEKIPGGNSKLGSITAAYFLIKESYETQNTKQLLKRYNHVKGLMESGFTFVDEELTVKQFLEDVGAAGGIAANNTSGVEVKNPDAIPKKKKKYSELVKRK